VKSLLALLAGMHIQMFSQVCYLKNLRAYARAVASARNNNRQNCHLVWQVCELLLDAMIVRCLGNRSAGPCSQGVLAILPAVSLEAKGGFAVAVPDTSDERTGMEPHKRHKCGASTHIEDPNSVSGQFIRSASTSKSQASHSLRTERATGLYGGLDSEPAGPLGVPQPQIRHFVDVLGRCVSGGSPGGPPSGSKEEASESTRRAALLASSLQKRLESAFGPVPGSCTHLFAKAKKYHYINLVPCVSYHTYYYLKRLCSLFT
jgi:hypothetical protein